MGASNSTGQEMIQSSATHLQLVRVPWCCSLDRGQPKPKWKLLSVSKIITNRQSVPSRILFFLKPHSIIRHDTFQMIVNLQKLHFIENMIQWNIKCARSIFKVYRQRSLHSDMVFLNIVHFSRSIPHPTPFPLPKENQFIYWKKRKKEHNQPLVPCGLSLP